jgi:hypothetical protein
MYIYTTDTTIHIYTNTNTEIWAAHRYTTATTTTPTTPTAPTHPGERLYRELGDLLDAVAVRLGSEVAAGVVLSLWCVCGGGSGVVVMVVEIL